ncbi:uncharacterized protein LACBIDRAFT_328205 [Laccaria bicolor S238N-H82]|uniref:Predicted protein n=1 Tax=Laccaria bicolor (strain S238N-H82 / ATCC MYA-4686) TaxID=486041 RepID=B0DE26_LACBS|nr:uncharacterized protein LACBIDRAFT_328205 [Laccaria bicolor S238N-H82]EDR07316.1 predicted protein [Laccaria bicolor S238N-H82]|eukprot:XP_001882247.1 predicted protein [Laccaria bicolor S238N-H82]
MGDSPRFSLIFGRLYLRGLRTGSPLDFTRSRSPFASTGTGLPFAQAPIDTAGLSLDITMRLYLHLPPKWIIFRPTGATLWSGVEESIGFYDGPRADTPGDDVLRDTPGDDVTPPGAGPDTQTEPETEGGYNIAPSQLSERDELSMADLLLLFSHHSPAAHPITGAEA